jgi:hypothetical protein
LERKQVSWVELGEKSTNKIALHHPPTVTLWKTLKLEHDMKVVMSDVNFIQYHGLNLC